MKLPSPELQEYIENLINTRLESSVDYSHVLRWLDNFEDEDQLHAINVLSKIEYFSYNRILDFISSQLNKIDTFGFKKNYIIPIGNPGKSGCLIQYICQQILKGKRNYVFIRDFRDIVSKGFSNDDAIFLVDDIIGSGNTFIDWLKSETMNNEYGELLNRWIKQSHVNILSIILTPTGLKKINSEFPTIQIFADLREKAFQRVGSIFGGSVKMLPYRNFCYKYGKMLSPKNPLGYENTQALIIFDHSAPNNTLPIIWANKKFKNGKSWYPLYPRFVDQRINTSKNKEKEDRKRLVQLHELFGYDIVTKQLFTTVNLYLLEMLTLKIHNMSEHSIAQKLSLPIGQIDNLWQKGVDIGLWDVNHDVTEKCRKRYKEKLKEIRFRRTDELDLQYKYSSVEYGNVIYIPETFRGVK